MATPFIINMRVGVDDVDLMVIGNPKSRNKAESIAGFLTDEISKAGGEAVVAVDGETAQVEWMLPELSSPEDAQQVAYVAHAMQAGLLRDPSQVIANTAYSGGVSALALNLLNISSSGRNRYLAERDARILARVAPLSVQALSVLGLILLEGNNPEEAAVYFVEVQKLDPLDFLSAKYLAVALTNLLPDKAVMVAERALAILASRGLAPDAHMRSTYGMALLAAKSKAEAKFQFLLACGSESPAMSPRQWAEGGYRITNAEVPAALAPKKKKP